MMYSDLVTVRNSAYQITAYDDGLTSFTRWDESDKMIGWHHHDPSVTGDCKGERVFDIEIRGSYSEHWQDFNFTQSWHLITLQTSLLDKVIKVIELMPLLREQWKKWII